MTPKQTLLARLSKNVPLNQAASRLLWLADLTDDKANEWLVKVMMARDVKAGHSA